MGFKWPVSFVIIILKIIKRSSHINFLATFQLSKRCFKFTNVLYLFRRPNFNAIITLINEEYFNIYIISLLLILFHKGVHTFYIKIWMKYIILKGVHSSKNNVL